MQTTHFLPLSSSIKMITILALVILVVGIVILFNQWSNTRSILHLCILALLVVVTVGTLAIVPRKATVTQEEIRIHLLAWRINIPKDEVVKIEHYPQGIDSHRIVGAGGFFGNLGLFDSSACGKHLSLITDPQDACVITRKNKKPIVVSVKDYSVFNAIAEVQEKN